MIFANQRGVIDDGEAIDASLVKALDPESEGAIAFAAVTQDQRIRCANEQQMHGIETLVGYFIGTAILGLLQFFDGAVFGIGKMVRTTDAILRMP